MSRALYGNGEDINNTRKGSVMVLKARRSCRDLEELEK